MNSNYFNDEKNINAAIQVLTINMLEHILLHADNPVLLSEYLTRQMRELLGGKIVALIECNMFSGNYEHRIINVCPERHKNKIDCSELYQLVEISHEFEHAQLWSVDNGPQEVRKIFKERQWGVSIVLPLLFGKNRFGILFIFDLMDLNHAQNLVDTLETLTNIIALVLKNFIQYENLERIINLRTNEIAEKERQYRILAEISPVGIFRLDNDGNCNFTNERWIGITGLSYEKALSKEWIEAIHKDDREFVLREWFKNIDKKENLNLEFRVQKSDGTVIWVLSQATPELDLSGKVISYIGTFTDISEQKQDKEHLRSSLLEKESLIRELYHRTKNNMQIIRSMLGLKSSHTNDLNVKNAFKDMENRLYSMALVHQKLYQSQNLSSINLKEYISDLADLLFMSYNISSEKINIIKKLDDIFVLIDYAISCGLILNELISNSLKCGFPGNKKGSINILAQKNGKQIELIVTDNGIGFPQGFNAKISGKAGLQSVFAIGENQLHGRVSVESKNGVSCKIQFEDIYYYERISYKNSFSQENNRYLFGF